MAETRIIPIRRKDPSARKPYGIDWTGVIGADLISTSTWEAPAGIVQEGGTSTATTTAVWVSGGELGRSYDVVNRITTLGGLVDDQTIRFVIEQT